MCWWRSAVPEKSHVLACVVVVMRRGCSTSLSSCKRLLLYELLMAKYRLSSTKVGDSSPAWYGYEYVRKCNDT